MFVAYFLPFGLLPLFSIRWSIAAIFILFMNIISTCFDQTEKFAQQVAPAVPFLYIAFLFVLADLKNNPHVNSFYNNISKRMPIYLFEGLLVISLLLNMSPASKFWNLELPDKHDSAIDSIIEMIPNGVTVTTTNKIFPHVCDSTDVYLYYFYNNYIDYGDNVIWGYPERYTDYVIVDWLQPNQYYEPGTFWEAEIIDTIYEEYESVIKIDNVELFKIKG
jgi:hypothetical protein